MRTKKVYFIYKLNSIVPVASTHPLPSGRTQDPLLQYVQEDLRLCTEHDFCQGSYFIHYQ